MHERPRSAQQIAWNEPEMRADTAHAWARHSHEGVVVLDAQAAVEFVSARALSLLGLSSTAGEAEIAHALYRLLPASAPRTDQPAAHFVEYACEDGQKRWLRVSRLRVASNEVRGGSSELVMLADHTAQKQTEDQIARLSAELAKRAVERVELAQTIQELEELALRDPLTGLLNRRAFQERLEGEVARAQRHGSELSLLLVDIDHFKRINDSYGHVVGDVALTHVAHVLGAERRVSDVVARYGGEEFALLAPHTTRDGALALAERLRQAVRTRPYRVRGGQELLCVSVGVATLSVRVDRAAELLIDAADRALYVAKREGRDRVSAADL
jgi:diguanylate cyclase (GGDEF)-like protein